MNLLLITDDLRKSQPIVEAAIAAGSQVVKQIGINDEVSRNVEQYKPDGMIVVSEEMSATTLAAMRSIVANYPLPIVVMTSDSKDESINSAVRAGASAYVVDCTDVHRIGSLLRVAQSRFKELQLLHKELEDTKDSLVSRKHIEKAKGIIMKQKNLSEDEAYKAMRKLAMNHNKRIADIAEQLIAAAEVLI